jgi:hypothetical protein
MGGWGRRSARRSGRERVRWGGLRLLELVAQRRALRARALQRKREPRGARAAALRPAPRALSAARSACGKLARAGRGGGRGAGGRAP